MPETYPGSLSQVSGNRIRESAERRLSTLVEDLSNPEKWASLRSSYTTTRLRNLTIARLKQLEVQTGARSHDAAVTLLLESTPRENLILAGTPLLVWHGDSPVSIIGPSGAGKTRFVKDKVLPTTPCPVLICDIAGEYQEQKIRRVSLSDLIGLKWNRLDPRNTLLRFSPNPNPALSAVELDMLFGYLNSMKQEDFQPGVFPSGQLAKWCFVLEEAHRLRGIKSAIDFVLEGRKFTRKIVTVTSDAALFATCSLQLKPPPLEKIVREPTKRLESEPINQ